MLQSVVKSHSVVFPRVPPPAAVMARIIQQGGDRLWQSLVQHNIPGLRWLLEGFNYYDAQRVKEVGPDRAAAEWIVRCGGSVKFDKLSAPFSDYNELIRRTAELDPRLPDEDVRVVHIHAIDAGVTGFGCRHFAGLNAIIDVRFVRCKNLQDYGLEYMGKEVGKHLNYLEIDSCGRISDHGLRHLEKCTGLKSLLLSNLPRVRDKKEVLANLKEALPKCEIHYPDNV